jgi:hypothetical protein
MQAMSMHVQLFHTKEVAEYTLGHPVVLPAPLFCCCGFSTTSGNKLAKHLALSGCRSAKGLPGGGGGYQPMSFGRKNMKKGKKKGKNLKEKGSK